MSNTLFVEYGKNGFWAYDVAVGILLKYLIDLAGSHAQDDAWLHVCVEQWRINAVIADFGLYLDDTWTPGQVNTIRGMLRETCDTLAARDSISAPEMAGWSILNGLGVDSRGASRFPTAPVVELGHAIDLLLADSLPSPPPGSWWFYGSKTGRRTMKYKGVS